MSCDRPHECPVCSARIGTEKGTELAMLSSSWLETGGFLAFVTMDVARKPGEPMTEAMTVLKSVKARFNRLAKGWLAEAESLGTVESTEMTIDRSWNGSGHPHYMRLFYFRNAEMLGEFQRVLGPIWARAAGERGRFADPIHGFHVAYPELTDDGSLQALGTYFTKTGSSLEREMLSHGSKSARTEGSCAPFELLAEIERSGDYSPSNPMVRTWHVYCEAMRQVPVAIYSRFLKRTLREVARTGKMFAGQLELGDEAAPLDDPDVAAALAEEGVTSELEGETVVEVGRQAVKFLHRLRLWGTLFSVVEDLAEWGEMHDTRPDYVAAVKALLKGHRAPPEVMAEIWRPGEMT